MEKKKQINKKKPNSMLGEILVAETYETPT